MAHTSLSPWSQYEKFNVSFENVAGGWKQVEPGRAAAAVRQILGHKVNLAEEKPVRGRLFMLGDMGHVGSEKVIQALGDFNKGLNLAGILTPERSAKSPAGSFVSAEQIVEDRPIFGARLTLHMNAEGRAYALVGTPAPKGLKVRGFAKSIDKEGAARIVASALETSLKALSYRARGVFLPVGEELISCWHIEAAALKPFGVWYGFVSDEGKLLAIYNVASSVSGTANGYKVNPFRSSLETLTLDNLTSPAASLTGATADVWGPDHKRVSSTNGSFLYKPDATEFDEPQLYYFLGFCRNAADRIASGRLVDLLNEGRIFNPMKGTVHFSGAADNAYFWPDTGELFFGDINDDPPRYTSRSLDIVLHEFGHAISDSVCELGRASSNNPSRAMSEGYSDYFAATVLNNPVMGDYFQNDPKGFRSCANSRKFPRGFAGEEHEVGTVWAGFLWDLRQNPAIGRDAADTITIQSLSYLGPWRTIPQGLEAVVQADRALFVDARSGKGSHEDVIRKAFSARQP